MTSSPPTLTGFNNNVRYRGMRFHIQTEDSGITRPHITTLLFADGGYVIKSLRTDYAEYVGHPERAALVHRLMRDQHRAMALDLRDGKLDATIARITPTPNDAALDDASTLSSLPISSPPPPVIPEPPLPNVSIAHARDDESASSLAPSPEPSPPEGSSITVKSGTLVAVASSAGNDGATVPSEPAATIEAASAEAAREAVDERSVDVTVRPPPQAEPAGAADPIPTPPASSRRNGRTPDVAAGAEPPSPSSRRSNGRGGKALRSASGRNSGGSARPPGTASGAEGSASDVRPASGKGATRHRVIAVGEVSRSGKSNADADAANRASAPRRSPSGSRSATTQRPPNTPKSTSGGSAAEKPPGELGAANHGEVATQRPPSSRKPPTSARAADRPPPVPGSAPPSSKRGAAARPASNDAATARPASSRPSPRPPSSRGAATSSKRSRPASSKSSKASSTPPAPSSRRAGRPSPALAAPKGGKSLFGPLPQESLDDAILSFAATVKNGPPTRGSK